MVYISQYIQRLAGNMQMTQDMPITDSMNFISIWKPRPKIEKKGCKQILKEKVPFFAGVLNYFYSPITKVS